MGGKHKLGVQFPVQELLDLQQGRNYRTLPLGMQMAFDFIDNYGHMLEKGFPRFGTGPLVFLPCPEYQIGQGDDTLDAGSGMNQGDGAAGIF